MELQQLCKLVLLQIAHMFPIIKLPRIAACEASIWSDMAAINNIEDVEGITRGMQRAANIYNSYN